MNTNNCKEVGKDIKSIELLTRDNPEEVWEALGSEHGVGVGIGHLKHNPVQGGRAVADSGQSPSPCRKYL